jgi:hypothetical protein
MANVDDGTKWTTEKGRNARSNTIDNHTLSDGEGITSFLGTHQTHECGGGGTNSNRDDDTKTVNEHKKSSWSAIFILKSLHVLDAFFTY